MIEIINYVYCSGTTNIYVPPAVANAMIAILRQSLTASDAFWQGAACLDFDVNVLPTITIRWLC